MTRVYVAPAYSHGEQMRYSVITADGDMERVAMVSVFADTVGDSRLLKYYAFGRYLSGTGSNFCATADTAPAAVRTVLKHMGYLLEE